VADLTKKALDVLQSAAKKPESKQEKSMFELLGKKAATYAAPIIERAAPSLQKAMPVLTVLNKPQEYATKAADILSGGAGNAESFADIGVRLNKKLPESMQNEGLAKDIGYAADIAFPSPKLKYLKPLINPESQAIAKSIASSILATGDISTLNAVGKASAQNVNKALAGLDNTVTRNIPIERTILAGARVPVQSDATRVLKGGKEIVPLINPPTIDKTMAVNIPGAKIIQGASEIVPRGIKPATNRQSAAEVLKRMQEANLAKGKK
jgi:hypothetical protein